jgi:uncharacterized protein (TIGR02246 family)
VKGITMQPARCVALAALTLLAAPGAWAADDAASKELQGAVDKYVAAYNTGAVDKVMAFWTEDADFVDIRGGFHQGRDLIAALFRRGFADNPGRTMKLASDARKFLAPTVAMDDGILELKAADGETYRGRYAVVWTKGTNGWRIRSARDIPLEEEEPESTEPSPPPLEELAWLEGKWQAKSAKHQITLDCAFVWDKTYMTQRFNIKGADEEFHVLTFVTFDPTEARFRSWYFDSRGGFGGGLWSKRDKVWRTEILAVMPDGQIGSNFMSWEQVDENTARWTSTEREVEGEILPDIEQTYVRVKSTSEKPK